MQVKITSLDVNLGVADERSTTFNPLRIKAVADAPGIRVTHVTNVGIEDDGKPIPLNIIALPSLDEDGSETISVKITLPMDSAGPVGNITAGPEPLPTGVTITNQGEGVSLVQSATGLDLLNQVLADKLAYKPRPNFAGNYTGTDGIRIDVISTEAATGDQVQKKTATATDYIDIVVLPVLDVTVVSVKGNAGT
jgi:hypothetical protein